MIQVYHGANARALQLSVAKLAARGKNYELIAKELGQTEETVKLLLGSPAMRELVAKEAASVE